MATAVRPTAAAGLVITLMICSACCAMAGAAAAAAPARLRPKTWMFPILRWGPNNQKRDLRHVIALAKQMDAGIILPGMYKHYRDAPPPPAALPPRPPAGLPPPNPPHPKPPAPSTLPAPPPKRPPANQTQPTARPPQNPPSAPANGSAAIQDQGSAVETGQKRGSHIAGMLPEPLWPFMLRRGLGEGGRPLSTPFGACFSEPVPRFLPFEEVLDRAPIHDFVPTATVDELQEMGWDRSFDALVHPNSSQAMSWGTNYYVQRAFEAQGVHAAPDAVQIAAQSPLHCHPNAVAALKRKISEFRFVAVQVVLLGYSDMYDLKVEAKGPNRTDSTKQACHQTLHAANGVVRLAPWLRGLAMRYMQEVAGIGMAPYMAVHVRPFPDSCLDRWRWGSYLPDRMRDQCVPQHANLHMRVGACVVRASRAAGLPRVFVMTHPSLRVSVNTMLSVAGLPDAIYLDAQKLLDLAGCVDTTATFLAMVEEEIAVQATHFVGTSISSATHTIAYVRIGLGAVDDEFLETMDC